MQLLKKYSLVILILIASFYSGMFFSNALTTIDGSGVYYTNINNSTDVNNVSAALDDLSTKIQTNMNQNGGLGNTLYSSITHNSAGTNASYTVSRTLALSSPGIYIVNLILGRSGLYSISSYSLTGTADVEIEFITNVTTAFPVVKGSGTNLNYVTYRVKVNSPTTLTGKGVFKTSSTPQATQWNSVLIQAVQVQTYTRQ